MSPEQASGKVAAVGRGSDVYSLGAVLYETLTGKPPFKGANPVETLKQVVDDEPVPPSQLNPAVLKDLETIVLKCLEKDPGRRYPTAKALSDDLERFLRGEGVAAKRASVASRVGKQVKRRWVPLAAGAAGLVAAVLVAVLLFAGSARDKELKSLLQQAARLMADGKHAQAVSKYEAVLALAPGDAAAAKGLDAARREQRRLEEEAARRRDAEAKRIEEEKRKRDAALAKARTDLDQAGAKVARARKAFEQLGSDLAQADALLQEAIAQFGRAIEAAPELGDAYRMRGRAHYLRQDLPAAERDFTAAIQARLASPGAHYDRGRVYLDLAAEAMGQLRIRGAAAEEEARELREKAKADLAAFREKGAGDDPEQLEFAEALLARSELRHSKVLEICDALIARKTVNEEVDRLKGDTHFALGEAEKPGPARQAAYAAAADAYAKALQKRPNYPEVFLRRGQLLFRLGKADEAVRDLERSISADRPNASWYALRGSIQFEMGRGKEALADYERALQLRPEDPGILSNLAMLLVQQRDFRRANDLFERALKVNPQFVDALAGRGAARAGLGDSAGALEDLNAALPSSPRKSQLHHQIGLVHLERKEWEKADRAFSLHLELSPRSESGWFHRGEARLHLDRLREAIADWEKALELPSPRADLIRQRIEETRRRL
jgi:tetratricopeptide (TPR) repeat protein